MKKMIKQAVVLAVLASSLQGCVFVAGAAAGAAAIAVVNDHRSISHTLEDTKLANKVFDKINGLPNFRNDSHVEVTAFNHVILLTGQTPNPAWRQQAEAIARDVPNVSKVYNQLTIQGPTSSLTRTSDAWITTKIKSLMLADNDLKSSSIKVVTENGDVFLMGMVTRDQADIAVSIARQVTGVQKVVKVFQYTN